MPFDKNSLQEYIYSSERQYHVMQKYCDMFNTIFNTNLISFGYERWNSHGLHMGLSNTPRMAELYIDTGAPEDQKLIIHPDNSSSISTFIQYDPEEKESKYNLFRQELEKNFHVRTSFLHH